MYNDFFQFSEKPFNVTPDPKFLYLAEAHREALASMLYGVTERKGFIAVVGEVGCGKTTLIYSMLNSLNEKVRTALAFNSGVTFTQLLKGMLTDLGVEANGRDRLSLFQQLNDFLISCAEKGETVALIVDEAQNLPTKVLEEIRMLSNLETCKEKLLQVLLVGQPELERKLNLPRLRQLKQRIGVRCRLRPLTFVESVDYIEHRLSMVGSSTSSVFNQDALILIASQARGIPRVLNILCDNSLLMAYGMGRPAVNGTIVQEVIRDMDGELSPPAPGEAAEPAFLSGHLKGLRQPFLWRVRGWVSGLRLHGPPRREARRRVMRDDATA
jgi:general secretion pathway protein A